MAAKELPIYVEKITGARLPIASELSGELPVRIFVGQSQCTERLGLETKEE